MSPRPITENTLFYGDNLFILREHIPSESVDLIYLDPPFNSSRNYNVLFKEESGTESEAQITAFEDTWHWNLAAEHTYVELLTEAPDHVGKMIDSLRDFIGTNQMMAYLVMMAGRLVELHRVLKPTGSLYLHCDPTASHYLKIILDTIFNPQNFRNEIIWKRQSAHSDAKTKFADVTDTDAMMIPMPYRFMCNDAQREGAKPSPSLASKLFCYVPLYNFWYGILCFISQNRLNNCIAEFNKIK